jgi:radical SAM superfamily enzyme YgiQ (UPF0313 family)
MKILLVYPLFPQSYWGFQHAMPLVGKRALLPPLGLITLAGLLPREHELRLIDLNVRSLDDTALQWADVVFVGGMRVQADSIHDVIARAKALGRRTVVGGPAPTTAPEEYQDADILFLGEAEGRIASLLEAIDSGSDGQLLASRPMDRSPESGCRQPLVLDRQDQARPDMGQSPIPRFDLLELDAYASMALQYSRGCPFRCEFCDIIEIFGRVPRVKTPAQVLRELEALYELGFRGSLFVVDDNFIGNRAAAQQMLAPVILWQKERGYPFDLYTEASINLAREDKLLQQMVDAGFFAVFIGIESPSKEALASAAKRQNVHVDLEQAIDTITARGIEVYGGFIVGFDSDDPAVFEQQLQFISRVPVAFAMVGLLMALPGTALWRRLKVEGRLRSASTGDQFGRPNFVPTMDEKALLEGYARLMEQLYSPEAYYRRCEMYVDRAAKLPAPARFDLSRLAIAARTIMRVGIARPYRRHFWRLALRSLRRSPHTFSWVIVRALTGEHLIHYTRDTLLRRLEQSLRQLEREEQTSVAPRAAVGAG